MPNFMIINGKNEYFEYVAENDLDALDRYVEEKLGFESGFTVSKTFWGKLKDKIENPDQYTVDDRVRLVNGFCRNRRHRIERVITGYSIDYPILVRFVNNNEFYPEISVYENRGDDMSGEVLLDQEFAVHYGDTLSVVLIAAKGYEINSVLVTDAEGNTFTDSKGQDGWIYDEISGELKIQTPITSHIKVEVTPAKISHGESDWRVALYTADENDLEKENIEYVQDGNVWTYELDLNQTSWGLGAADGCRITTYIYKNGVLTSKNTTTAESMNPIISIPDVHSHLYVKILYESYYE